MDDQGIAKVTLVGTGKADPAWEQSFSPVVTDNAATGNVGAAIGIRILGVRLNIGGTNGSGGSGTTSTPLQPGLIHCVFLSDHESLG